VDTSGLSLLNLIEVNFDANNPLTWSGDVTCHGSVTAASIEHETPV